MTPKEYADIKLALVTLVIEKNPAIDLEKLRTLYEWIVQPEDTKQ